MAQPSLDALSYGEQLAVDELRREVEETLAPPHTPWRTPPRHLDWGLTDVLVAYLALRDEHVGYALPMFATALAAPCAKRPSAIDQIVELARRYPEHALTSASDVLADVLVWSPALFENDAPGGLTREVYDACDFHLNATTRAPSRTAYLRERVAARAAQLTDQEAALASTLVPDWAGTLDELLETSSLLRPPDGSRAARASTDCRGRSLRHRR